MKNLATAMSLMLSLTALQPVIAQDTFPAHQAFPDIPVYTKPQLAEELDRVVVVDTRPSSAFAEIHIKDAVNIPVRSKMFAVRINALRKQTTHRIVFYCNDRTSRNPYIAAQAAMDAGVKNVFAYDGGIYEWAESYPGKIVLARTVSANPYALQLARQY